MTRKTLRTLARALRLVATALEAEAKAPRDAQAATRPRRKLTITPKRRAQLKLQGEYIGRIRMLPTAQKERIRRVREQRGPEAAIRLARKLAKAA